jgi:hypothetical protein
VERLSHWKRPRWHISWGTVTAHVFPCSTGSSYSSATAIARGAAFRRLVPAPRGRFHLSMASSVAVAVSGHFDARFYLALLRGGWMGATGAVWMSSRRAKPLERGRFDGSRQCVLGRPFNSPIIHHQACLELIGALVGNGRLFEQIENSNTLAHQRTGIYRTRPSNPLRSPTCSVGEVQWPLGARTGEWTFVLEAAGCLRDIGTLGLALEQESPRVSIISYWTWALTT